MRKSHYQCITDALRARGETKVHTVSTRYEVWTRTYKAVRNGDGTLNTNRGQAAFWLVGRSVGNLRVSRDGLIKGAKAAHDIARQALIDEGRPLRTNATGGRDISPRMTKAEASFWLDGYLDGKDANNGR